MACQSRIICIFFLFISQGWAIEYQPWLGNYLEFEWHNSALYQTYTDIAQRHHRLYCPSDAVFLTTSLSNALLDDGNRSIELEATVAHTHHQHWGMDNLRLAGRQVWLNDFLGDPLTLTVGAVLTQTLSGSLYDISSFHHGRREAELFVSAGQDISAGLTWGQRWWGVIGLGVGDRGSPWSHCKLVYEQRLRNGGEGCLFLESLIGWGQRHLHPCDFHGYGSIKHRSVDIGLRYTNPLPYLGSWSVEYAYRLYAYNFPAQTHSFLIQFLYTFGL